jgi:hypothetical protein
MSFERDLDDEMQRFGLDDDIADRLLSGQVAPEDAPPEFRAIARVVQAVQYPAGMDAARESATVAAIVEALHSSSPSDAPARRKRLLARALTAKVAALVAVGVLGATMAAAATNMLPDPAQSAISDAASHLGLSVPHPDGHGSGLTKNHPPTAGNDGTVGPHANGPAMFGLCTAFSSGNATTNAHSHKTNSVAFRNVQAAADKAGMSVADFCKTATPPSTDTTSTSIEETAPTTPNPHHANPAVSTPIGPPVSTPVGPPPSTPVGPPVSTPVGPPVSTPVRPPVSVGPPVSTPVGPPVSTPVGPPVSTPGHPHRP